jgi:PhzF family phenazine biosynthesis protein
MLLPFTTLDVFTGTRYRGNPLSIIRVPASHKSSLSQTRKQEIGTEFNLSEIVFLHEKSSPESDEVAIDIFTSKAEVPFAGHPTIGTANYLFQNGQGVKSLLTKAGRIGIEYDKKKGMATLSLPQDFHVHSKTWENSLGDAKGELISIVKGMSFLLVQCRDLETLEREATKTLVADTFGSMHFLDDGWQEGLIGTYYYVVLQESDEKVKIRSRMFGTREDPATGSAGSGFACWFALKMKSRECRFDITQGVEMGRQSEISVKIRKTEDEKGVEEVLLSGSAVKVMEGSIEVE